MFEVKIVVFSIPVVCKTVLTTMNSKKRRNDIYECYGSSHIIKPVYLYSMVNNFLSVLAVLYI